jgi:hypothetical protein
LNPKLEEMKDERLSLQILLAVAVVTLVIGGCKRNFTRVASAPPARQPAGKISSTPDESMSQNEHEIHVTATNGYATVREAGFSFTFKAADYGRVAMTKEEKFIDSEPSPIGSWPEHRCFHLEDKRPLPALEQGPRYFFPAKSHICFIPLNDPSEKEFGKAYPEITLATAGLRRILSERPKAPDTTKKALPDLPVIEAGQTINSKVQFMDFAAGSGILFLTQYTQEMFPNPINNEELTCDFQGLTKDGKYYVAARMAITHPSLPEGIDFTDHIERDEKLRYLKEGEKRLNGLPDDSFRPSLPELKRLLASISVK